MTQPLSVRENWQSIANWYTRRSLELEVPAATLAIMEEGKLHLVRHEAAPHDTHDLSSIALGCLTKVLTAHAILVLIARGQLRLTDRLSEVLLDIEADAIEVLQDVRVGHLLAHTSGITRATDHLASFAPPGELYSYDKLNYVLLGRILGKATGRDWLESVTSLVLKPLGLDPLQQTSHEAEPFRAASSEVLCMPVEDLCRYASLHLHPGPDAELASVVAMMRSAPAWSPQTADTDVMGFAFKHNSSGNYGHIGLSRTGRIDLMISPGRATCVVHAIRGRGAQLCGEVLGGKLGLWAIGRTLKAAMREPPPRSLEACAGTYRHGGVEITISCEHGALWYRCSIDAAAIESPPDLLLSEVHEPVRLQKVAPRLCVVPGMTPPLYVEFVGGARVESFGFIRVGESICARSSRM